MSSCHSRIYGAEFTDEEIRNAVLNKKLLSLEIEFNSSCNFNCIYCYANNNLDPSFELSREQIKDVILQAKDLGARKIIILGGEPLLYPHIVEMVRFISGEGFRIEIFTNGVNLTEEKVRALYECGVAIILKMNSFKEDVQDRLAGKKGAYRQIKEAFRNLKLAGYPSPGHHMGISTIICRQNIDELLGMWAWVRDQGIDPYFEMITSHGKARENNRLLQVDSKVVKDLFFKISEMERTKYGNDWVPQPPLIGGKCLRHQFSCSINSYGFVQPCVGVTIPVGNVREKKLKDIIRGSEVISDLRNYMETIKGPCSGCSMLSECYGCRGAAFQVTGDYLASDPVCWENQDRLYEIATLPVEASALIPHKPPIILIDRLMGVGECYSVSEMVVREDSIFLDDRGRLQNSVYPEIVAQAIAAHDGFKKMGKPGFLEGMLLGIKDLEISGDARVGDTLTIRVQKIAEYGDFGIIQGTVMKGKTVIAKGEIKIKAQQTAATHAAMVTD